MEYRAASHQARGNSTSADLQAEFADVGDGHIALFYRSQESQLRIAAAFVADALHRGRRCLYLIDDNDAATIRTALRDAGVAVEARIEADDLRIREASEVYLADGFDADRMIDALSTAAQNAVEDGYEGLSAAGENSWCFQTEVCFDRIVEFEAAFDACESDVSVATLCQYDFDRFDERAIAKALWTHEHVVYRETICRNPYYVPPEQYEAAVDPATNAQLMLEQTYQLARNRRMIERHQQRLSVVNRILRHDIRNDLNVVLGNLDWLREQGEFDEAEHARLTAIEEVAERLVARAEKARYVQRTLSDPDIDPVDLGAVVDSAVAEVRETHPEASITVAAEETPPVLADRHLRTALIELLINAIVHQTDDDPSVTITTADTGDTVTLSVINPGSPIPESDRRAVLQGIETQLEHGGGLGLWLVKWIVDNSRGRLHFPDGDECHVAIELRAVDQPDDRK